MSQEIIKKAENRLYDNLELNSIASLLQSPVRIKDESAREQIVQNLRYVFVLIGLLPNQYPNEIETNVLIEYIQHNYKLLHPDEIKVAFTMGVKGDLHDLSEKGIDMNCFGSFSAMYFTRVMTAYREKRQKVAVELDHHQKKFLNEIPYIPDNVKKAQAQREFDECVIAQMFEKYKQFGVVDLGYTTAKLVYDSLTGYHKVKEFDRAEKNEILVIAKARLDYKTQKIKEMKPIDYAQYKQKAKKLSELIEPQINDKETMNECYMVCIERCFAVMKETNFKF